MYGSMVNVTVPQLGANLEVVYSPDQRFVFVTLESLQRWEGSRKRCRTDVGERRLAKKLLYSLDEVKHFLSTSNRLMHGESARAMPNIISALRSAGILKPITNVLANLRFVSGEIVVYVRVCRDVNSHHWYHLEDLQRARIQCDEARPMSQLLLNPKPLVSELEAPMVGQLVGNTEIEQKIVRTVASEYAAHRHLIRRCLMPFRQNVLQGCYNEVVRYVVEIQTSRILFYQHDLEHYCVVSKPPHLASHYGDCYCEVNLSSTPMVTLDVAREFVSPLLLDEICKQVNFPVHSEPQLSAYLYTIRIAGKFVRVTHVRNEYWYCVADLKLAVDGTKTRKLFELQPGHDLRPDEYPLLFVNQRHLRPANDHEFVKTLRICTEREIIKLYTIEGYNA
ncbi:CUN082 hypothetical protein [Culex nigripalpus nucleopolyhedrovirus]|uniref:Uncharacterized protein n=1 Tax=Culex nigripalpus nucleopolyhedrovirus (isolate Florida/1997) TaxID=645993 RepID=Q919J4_NPVCO|nr:CUN082 hypothetical protein [Culex nigripalpus nucleopolyhedrovirus]AAK94160.1 CUN082 hypothetical protein [Culex nigripalpus nucleopolyhedrovirus]